MNAVIFDCETNAKIKSWKVPLRNDPKSLSNFPRVTQLAWQKVSLETGQVVNEMESIIKPDGWTIPTVDELIARKEKKPNFFVENNMSTDRCEKEGRPLPKVLAVFIEDLRDSEIVVAHNMNFDMKVIGAEMLRYDMSVGKQLIKVCTMEQTTDLCRIPNKSRYAKSRYKYPRLVELYEILFGREMEGNHDALDDVRGCKECFLRLIELNHFKF